MNRLETAQVAYLRAFGVMAPEPWGVEDERIARVLEQAVASRRPVPESFDWWGDLPPNAVA